MASGSSEGQFKALVEDVRGEVRVIAEGHSTLNHKIDRMTEALSKKLDAGFADIRTGIELLVKEVRQHHHNGHPGNSGAATQFEVGQRD